MYMLMFGELQSASLFIQNLYFVAVVDSNEEKSSGETRRRYFDADEAPKALSTPKALRLCRRRGVEAP